MSVKNSQAAVAARNLNAAFKHCRDQEPQRSVRTGQPDGAADELHARHFGREISRRAHLPADRIGMRALAGAIIASGFMLGAADATSANARPIIQQSQLKARPVLAKPAEVALNEKLNDSRRLIVKFAEGSAIRAVNGEFMQDADGVRVPGHAHDIFHINNALKTKPALLRSGAVRIDRLFSRPPEVLDADRASGMSRSGQELADLNLYHVVEFDSSVSPADAQALANSLIKLGVVETAYFEPKTRVNAVDVAPATPAFDYRQNHLDRAFDGKTRDPATGLFYNGIDARYAWNFPGGRGAGMKFIDVEFGWNTNHEDLASPTIPRDPDTSDRWHGTAILGLINAQPNGYGMTGIASDAKYGLVNVSSFNAGQAVDNLALAINRASGYAAPGDVVLIEVGIDFDYKAANCTYTYYSATPTVPVEHYQAIFDAIQNATANGIIVVETASNGSANLDDPCFGNRYNKAFRDSGAIMVGGSVKGSLQRVLTSSYGSRIDVNAQGNLVATTVSAENYNNLFAINPPDESQQYTSLFDGTSAAGAIVAGAILSIQGIQKARNGRTFTPAQMRNLLIAHGTDPAIYNFTFNDIGPMPNLRATIDWMLADANGNGISNGDELSSGGHAAASDYVVTAIASGNGTVTPASTVVARGGTVWLTASPGAGYVPVFVSGTCPVGSAYGNTYKTGQIAGNCTVYVRFATVPDSPSNVSAKSGNGYATFQFVPPPSDALAPVQSYTASCNGGTFTATAAIPPVRVNGLTNGITYACNVTAQNSIGTSGPSATVQVTPNLPLQSVAPVQRGK